MQTENIIRFSPEDANLNSFSQRFPEMNTIWNVEFFPGKNIDLYFKNQVSPDLSQVFQLLDDGQPIAIDFEWEPDRKKGDAHPIALIQLCSSKICVVLRLEPHEDSPCLREFLSTHSFFGKGCGNDRRKIALTFGKDFHINLEDISHTQLKKYKLSNSFNEMIKLFAGQPAAEFKNKKISISHWSQPINLQQLLYAGFDAVGLYECYSNFPGVRQKRNLPPFEEGRYPVIKKRKERKRKILKEKHPKENAMSSNS